MPHLQRARQRRSARRRGPTRSLGDSTRRALGELAFRRRGNRVAARGYSPCLCRPQKSTDAGELLEMVKCFVPEGSGDDQGDREETRGTEVRSTNSSCVLTRNIFTTNYSFCFDFFLLGAVSSNPPPPTRLLPV